MTEKHFWEIKNIEDKLHSSKDRMELIHNHINQLEEIRERIETDFNAQAMEIMNVINESKMLNRKVAMFHNDNMKRIALAEGDFYKGIGKSQSLFRKFRDMYSVITQMNDLLTKIELDVSLMQIELKELISKGEVLKLAGAPSIVSHHLDELISKFNRVQKQKFVFEGEVKKLNMLQELLLKKV